MNKKIIKSSIAAALMFTMTGCASISEEVKKVENHIIRMLQVEKEEVIEEKKFEEIVLVNEKNVKITAKDSDCDDLFGPKIELLIENNSNQTLGFQIEKLHVNGFAVEGLMTEDVSANDKSSVCVNILNSGMWKNDIETIEEVTMSFKVFNWKNRTKNWKTTPVTFTV